MAPSSTVQTTAIVAKPVNKSSSIPFYTLPAELKLRILSHLPVRQIVLARQVSQLFCELIDALDNQRLLFQPIQSRHQLRISSSVTDLVYFDPQSGIFETFARYVRHRGLCYTSDSRWKVVANFMIHWERRHGRNPSLNPAHPNFNPYVYYCRMLLHDLLAGHIHSHVKGYVLLFPPDDLLPNLSRRTKRALLYLGLTPRDLDAVLHKIRDANGDFFPDSIYRNQESPKKPIVRSTSFNAKMASVLGIPDISAIDDDRDVGDATDRGFHYFIKTERERASLREAIDGEGQELSTRAKALILEQTFLH